MSHEWMIDVLVNLRQYALKNYYVGLAEQLDDAIVAAAIELRRPDGEAEDEPRARTPGGPESPKLAIV